MSCTRMRTRWLTPALAALVALAAFGCGSSGTEVSAPRAPRQADASSESVGTDGGTTQVVRYRNVEFTVPAGWPIHDLEADPSTCVRFDVHAVYLGHPGADMRCPASVSGNAASVLVEPLDGATTLAPADVSAADVNGLAVEIDPTAAVEARVRAELPTVGLAVTVSYEDSPDTAQQILQSFRKITP